MLKNILAFSRLITRAKAPRSSSWSLFLVAGFMMLAVAALVPTGAVQAGVPTFSGGGPGALQDFAPVEAIVDINANEALTGGTVNATNVTLLECATGSTLAA